MNSSQSLEKYQSSLPAVARDRLELAVEKPHARDVMRTRSETRFVLNEEPSAPAERVAGMLSDCSKLAEELLGTENDEIGFDLAGFGNVNVQRYRSEQGMTTVVKVKRDMSGSTYVINPLGNVTSVFTESPLDMRGEGRFGRPAEGAQLYALLKAALAQRAHVKAKAN